MKTVSKILAPVSSKPLPGFVSLAIDGIGYHLPFNDAKLGTMIAVLPQDIAGAKCRDPQNCVIANAGKRIWGELLFAIVVGKTVFHVVKRDTNGKLYSTRYALDGALRKAVNGFDDEKGWNLPIGEYTLLPMSKTAARGGRKNRRAQYGGKGGKQSTLKGIVQASVARRTIIVKSASI